MAALAALALLAPTLGASAPPAPQAPKPGEAYEETLRTRRVCYYSRSRNRLWRKGEESGNVQELQELFFDCDADTLLVKVHQIGGAACHEGYRSCFFRRVDLETRAVQVVGERLFDPAQVYGKK